MVKRILMNHASRYNAAGETSASNASKPFLTFPVMEDIGFLLSEEFKSVSTASPILPGSGKVYDLIEFDVNFMALRQDTVSEKGHSSAFPDPWRSTVLILMLCRTGKDHRDHRNSAAHGPRGR